MSARFPIKGGVMQGDLDAAGFQILNLPPGPGTNLPTPAQAGYTLDVFVSFRTDGQTGTGTRVDPYDGSTQAKFDAIFNTRTVANTTGVTFHLGPGTFHTKGIRLLTGWSIMGTSMAETILYQDDNGSTFQLAIGYWTGHENDMAVTNLTLNCAYSRLIGTYPTGRFLGVTLTGARPFIENVKVINSGGGSETFPILVTNTETDALPDGFIINNCEVSSCGANCTGIGVANTTYGTTGKSHGGRISNCRVLGANIGLGVGGFDAALIIGNTIKDFTSAGIFQDSFDTSGLIIVDNVLRNTDTSTDHVGIDMTGTPTLKDFIIANNVIECNDPVSITTPNASGFIISTNRMISVTGGNHRSIAIAAGVTNTTVIDNIIDSGFAYFDAGTATTFRNNRTPAGLVSIPDANTDETVSFLPTTTGWYRVATQGPSSYGGGRMIVSHEPVGNNVMNEVEFEYSISGYSNGACLTELRNTQFGASPVDQARVSSDGAGNLYLDIHLSANVQNTKLVRVFSYGTPQFRMSLVAAPVVGAVAGSTDVTSITFNLGILTTGPLAAAAISGTTGLLTGGLTQLYEKFGSGSPEGVVTAPVGAIYHRTDGSSGTAFYRKESGSGNTGWVSDSALVAGGSGTVTTVSVVTANNLSGTVANPTTTPAITLTYTPPTEYARLVAATTVVATSGAAQTINWNTGTLWDVTLSANCTFTFTNATDGWDVSLKITNTASNWTVTWPAGIKWQGGVAPTMTIGAFSDVYTFIKFGSTIYGAVVQNMS